MGYRQGSIVAKWKDEEKEFLKRHYNIMPIDEIAEKINRSKEQIYSQVYYLRKRGWTFNRRSDAVS